MKTCNYRSYREIEEKLHISYIKKRRRIEHVPGRTGVRCSQMINRDFLIFMTVICLLFRYIKPLLKIIISY